jgi:hypothetical protein
MTTFKNTILIVLFNYSNCISNYKLIQKLYEKHFKKIIFYSDYPIIENTEVNFINTEKGVYAHKIFGHFYLNYRDLLDESDGLFYTMDDNIININIINLFDNKKIIYYICNDNNVIYNKMDTIENHFGWHWESNKYAINNLLNDINFKKYNITKFSGTFSDWFYLPKKYLTANLFNLFDLFAQYRVFIEIAIPSIIHNIEPDFTKYISSTQYNGVQHYTEQVLWFKEDRDKFLNKDYVYNSLKHEHNFILHPIKFNENPSSKQWLEDIFCKKNVL